MDEKEKKTKQPEEDEKPAMDVEEVLDKNSAATRARFAKQGKKKYFDMNLSWGMLVVMALATFGIAYAAQTQAQGQLPTGYNILFVLVSYLAAIAIYNLGKIMFGLASGYAVSKIEILGLRISFKPKANKVRYLFSEIFELHLAFVPKSPDDDPNPRLMLLGGTVFYAVIGLAVVAISFIVSADTVELIIMRYGAAMGALVVFYEMFPCKLDVLNDMYLLLNATNSKDNIKAYNAVLRQETDDLFGEYSHPILFTDYANGRIKAGTLLGVIHSYIYSNDYENAQKTIGKAEDMKMYLSDRQLCEILYEHMYLLLSHGRTPEAEKLVMELDRQLKRTADYSPSISSLRSDVFISGLIDNSLDETKGSIETMEKEIRYLGKTMRVCKDAEMANASIDRINTVHADWKIAKIDIDKLTAPKKTESDGSEDNY